MRHAIVTASALALFIALGVAARGDRRAPARSPVSHGEARWRPTRPAPPPRAAEPAEREATRLALPATPPERSVVVPILTYHRIAPPDPSLPAITRRLTVDPGDFARQLRWLSDNGFRPIGQRELFDALAHGRPLRGRPVLITIDDGYRNALTHAAPLLERHGFPATAYVISERLNGGDPSFLTCGQLRRLERRGVEIGSHSASHRDLTTLDDTSLAAELTRSRRKLERCVGHPVQWLAYPYGAHDARVVVAARRAGYVLAVTTLGGSQQAGSWPLELRRLAILDSTGVEGLAAMLESSRAPA